VKAQVGLSLFTDFEDFNVFKPAPQQEKFVNAMLDQVIAWGGALKPLRRSEPRTPRSQLMNDQSENVALVANEVSCSSRPYAPRRVAKRIS
jgi:hypothetical protein